MNKKIVYLIFCAFAFFTTQLYAQGTKYVDKAGHASFFSKAPLEDIEAHNHQAVSVLDVATGDVQVSLLMKSFKFEKALMQEHFNDRYVESDKYPKASFKGKITNLDKVNFAKEGKYPVDVSGTMTIHGVTNQIQAKGEITVAGKNSINATTTFPIAIRDYKIEVPRLVINNIAEVVQVTATFQYSFKGKDCTSFL